MAHFHSFLAGISLLIFSPIFSQAPFDATRLGGEIIFDGKVDEAAWQAVQPLDMLQQVPNFGQPPSERSEVRLAYDDSYLYLSGKFFLSDSKFYRATTYKRDAQSPSTDFAGFVIDNFNDYENAVAFFTTPTGLRWDGTVSNDAQIEDNVSIDWNTFWDAAVTRMDSGWSAEIRIPWSSLRFVEKDGEVIMGITVWWWMAAKNEMDIFPLISNSLGGMSFFKPSQAQRFRFRGIRASKPLYLTPYILAGYQEKHDLNENGTAYEKDKDPKIEIGGDLKYSISSNLTLDLTANTDFAQVEVDDEQVNLTRFNLFFPEKRQFFLERASIFDFQYEDDNRLFYSRRIGIEGDDPVRIYGGARLQGRLAGSDFGFLSMQTAATDSLHSENFSVLRLRRQAFNQYSYVGGIATSRMDFQGKYNSTYGFDSNVRLFGDDYLAVKWAQSFDSSKENEVFSLQPARIFLDWERRRYEGFSYKFRFSRAGEDWQPGMGFEERENFTRFGTKLTYGKLKGEDSKILRWQAFLKGRAYLGNTSHKWETANAEIGFQLESKNGWFVIAAVNPFFEKVPEAFELGGEAEIPVGSYDFLLFSADVATPISQRFGAFLEVNTGSFYDGNLISMELEPRMNVSAHLELSAAYQFNRAKFSERGQEFHSHLGKIKAEYLFNTKLALAAFLQYNSVDEVFVENVRLRYNPKEGNDLYVVFNDVLNSNRRREAPHLPFSDSRAVVVKYTYTFAL